MSAQNTAQTSPIVSSTSAGPARTSPSAVLTARYPSQASVQANQIAQLLAQAPAAQSADPTKDMAPILLPAAEMLENAFSGVMDTPEVRRGLFEHIVKPTDGWERLIKVEIPAPYIFKGAKRTVALVHQTRKFVSGRPGYEGLTCITVNMKIDEITEYFTHNIPCNYDGPFDFERTADGTLVRDGVYISHNQWELRQSLQSKWYTLKTEDFCTDYFFINHPCTEAHLDLDVDTVYKAYEELCGALGRIQRRGLCQHVRHRENDYHGHYFSLCSCIPWTSDHCYCVQHQHKMHIAKKRRIDED